MIYTFKRVVLFICILWAFAGCKKEPIGPDIDTVANTYPQLTDVYNSNRDTLHMSKNEMIYFNAHFKKAVFWKITLSGVRSGATKTITGMGTAINQLNSTWAGESDNPPLKFSTEDVNAVLSFNYTPSLTYSKKLYILGGSGSANPSVLVSDFANASSKIVMVSSFPPVGKWPADWNLPTPSNASPYSTTPDGNNCLVFSGAPWDKQGGKAIVSPYITFMAISANARDGGLPGDSTFSLYADPNQVYFNFYLFNTVTSGTNKAWFQINFSEIDGTQRTYELKQPDWTGWKLFSVKYSDLKSDGGIGRPDLLKKITFVLLTTQTDFTKPEKVSIAIDHPIFTFGKPL